MNPNLASSSSSGVQKRHRAALSDDVDLMSSVQLFFSMLGEVALDISSSIKDAPISFSEFHKVDILETESEIHKRLRTHYLYRALTQLFTIAGSLEMVGNPVGLFSSLGTGVKDLFFDLLAIAPHG